jgi:DNA polymerase III epsilon subunit-like protein
MASTIIGHNISFDINVVGAELLRIGSDFRIDSKPSICTMLSSMNYCAIPNPHQHRYGDPYKWPKLQELHKKLFGVEFEDAHDAMADIEATKRCFFELVKRNIIKP